MVSDKLKASLTKCFGMNKNRIKSVKNTPGVDKAAGSTKPKFIVTTHAKLRFLERGVKNFDETKLKRTYKPISNVFKNNVFKRGLNEDKNGVHVYWTDGEFTYISISEKAGQYKIVTVV